MTKGPEISIESVKAVVRQLVEQLWPHEINAFEMSLGQLTHWPYHWQYIEPAKWKVEDLLAEATASSGYAFPGILPEEARPWWYFALVIDAVADHLRSLEKVPEVNEMEAAYEKIGSHRELPNDVLAAGKPLVIKWLQSHYRKQLPPISISTKEESQQNEVDFTSTGVSLNKRKEQPFIDEWRMLEYFLWKNDSVHWTEGYLIYPGWSKLLNGATDGQTQFTGKRTKCRQNAEKHGLKIEFRKMKDAVAVWWELVTYNISTNITKAAPSYKDAEDLFDDDKWDEARKKLIETLKIYPNHLQSHLLLIRCYDKLPPEKLANVDLQQLQSFWFYLNNKCIIIDGIRRICSKKKKDKELQVFLLSLLNYQPYSQLDELTELLWSWIVKMNLTKDETEIMKINRLLRDIRTAKNTTQQEEKIKAFCRIPCVAEILTDEKLAEASSLLFFSRGSSDLIESRFQAVVTRSYKNMEDLQRFLRSTLGYLRKDLEKQERPTQFSQFGDYEKFDSDIKRLYEIEEKLRQELHKEKITDEELIEAAKKQTRWGIKYIKWLIERKNKKLYGGVRDDDKIYEPKEEKSGPDY